jgi:hypothetical protein
MSRLKVWTLRPKPSPKASSAEDDEDGRSPFRSGAGRKEGLRTTAPPLVGVLEAAADDDEAAPAPASLGALRRERGREGERGDESARATRQEDVVSTGSGDAPSGAPPARWHPSLWKGWAHDGEGGRRVLRGCGRGRVK